MNKQLGIVGAIVFASAVVLVALNWDSFDSGSSGAPDLTSTPSLSDSTNRHEQDERQTTKSAQPQPAERSREDTEWVEALRKIPEEIKTLSRGIGEFTEEQIAEYNRYAVIPFNPVVGQDCEEDPQYWNGELYERTSCTYKFERAHPYTEKSSDELRELAMTDAEAALILGRRIPTEEIDWHLRAAALAQKSGPIMYLAEQRAGPGLYMRVITDEGPTSVPNVDQMIEAYALETLAERLGDPRADSSKWRALIEKHAGQEAVLASQQLLTQYLADMSAIEESVTGANWVREAAHEDS